MEPSWVRSTTHTALRSKDAATNEAKLVQQHQTFDNLLTVISNSNGVATSTMLTDTHKTSETLGRESRCAQMRNGAAKCTEMRWERAHGLQVQRERNACLHHRCLHQRGALQSNKVRCLCANKTIQRSQRKIRHIGDRWMWLQLMWL